MPGSWVDQLQRLLNPSSGLFSELRRNATLNATWCCDAALACPGCIANRPAIL